MGERLKGKKLIGAQASPELWAAVDEWLVRNPNSSVTDFLLDACMEKLTAEDIPVDEAAVLRDGRTRMPGVERTITSYRDDSRREKKISSKPPSVVRRTAVASAPAALKLALKSEQKPKAGETSGGKV